jgi:GIY-YIG catalytic domain
MSLTEDEILKIVELCETELKTNERVKFTFDKKWSDNFPPMAGIYAIFYKTKLVYVGESANLKERMKEIKRTYNHSFRRKLGKHLDANGVIIKGKFSDELEAKLNEHYIKYLMFSFKKVNFGRLEIENYLMRRNEGVLNSIGKRSKL